MEIGMVKSEWQLALDIIELLLTSDSPRKYEIAKLYLENAKRKLKPV